MKKTHLTATITLAIRPVAESDYSDKLVKIKFNYFVKERERVKDTLSSYEFVGLNLFAIDTFCPILIKKVLRLF
jgi:hypothetical protein